MLHITNRDTGYARYDSREDAIILKTTGDATYRTMFLQEPDRLVIDFHNTVFRSDTNRIDVSRVICSG